VDPEGAEPVYLEFADTLELYAAIVGGTPAQAADQLRDPAGLESALGRSRNPALYEDADLALQAAALAHGIAESQTFIDGNKRLALIAMLTFLEANGFEVEASDRELAAWIIGLSPEKPKARSRGPQGIRSQAVFAGGSSY